MLDGLTQDDLALLVGLIVEKSDAIKKRKDLTHEQIEIRDSLESDLSRIAKELWIAMK